MTRTTTHCQAGCCRTGRPDACYHRWSCDCHQDERTATQQADKLWAWQQEALKESRK